MTCVSIIFVEYENAFQFNNQEELHEFIEEY